MASAPAAAQAEGPWLRVRQRIGQVCEEEAGFVSEGAGFDRVGADFVLDGGGLIGFDDGGRRLGDGLKRTSPAWRPVRVSRGEQTIGS